MIVANSVFGTLPTTLTLPFFKTFDAAVGVIGPTIQSSASFRPKASHAWSSNGIPFLAQTNPANRNRNGRPERGRSLKENLRKSTPYGLSRIFSAGTPFSTSVDLVNELAATIRFALQCSVASAALTFGARTSKSSDQS